MSDEKNKGSTSGDCIVAIVLVLVVVAICSTRYLPT